MSLFRHILVLGFIFANYQSAKLEDDRSTPKVDVKEVSIPTEPDAAKFSFNRTRGQLTLKINMEISECINDKKKFKALKDPEEATPLLGTKENPAEYCDDVDDTGEYYIKSNMSGQAFKVHCDLEKKATCLITNSTIQASSIDSTSITKGDQIWLSQTKFDVELLYNKIVGTTGTNREQISYLLSTSTSVYQKIKYYYSTVLSNGTFIKPKKEDNQVGSLKALLWNDHIVGSKITEQFPMQFTFSNTEPCWSGSHWMCSDIVFQDKTNNRLPVTDFYIKDVRAKPDVLQKIYFELDKLCFNYD